MDSAIGLIAVFALVLINGFFVAAEFGLVGARRTRITQLADAGHGGAQAAQNAIAHLDNYIAATQLGITLASLGLGWIGEPAVAHLLEDLFEAVLGREVAAAYGHSAAIIIGFSLVTMLHIVFGELAPKAIALQRPEGTSLIVARPTTWFFHLFRPVIFVMNTVGNGVVRLIGFEPASGHEQVHSAKELLMLVQSAHEAGILQDREELLLHRAFDFGDLPIREVMQPRVEVDAIGVSTPIREVLETVSTGRHSRYPVYDTSIDHVIGLLHAKDLLDLVVHQPAVLTGDGSDFDLRGILRQPLFFPEMASAGSVMEQMQRQQMHFSVVLDEFGGMSGIATLEDIIEELVGEVQDEFDAERAPVSITANEVALDGLVTMHDVGVRFGLLPEGEPHSTTIGGYIAERLDRIPVKSDRVRYGGYDVVVEEMDEMRVARVRMVRRQPPCDTPESSDDCEPADSRPPLLPPE